MSEALRFCIFQTMIVVPFVLGVQLKRRLTQGPAFTRRLIRLNLIVIEPVIVLWSIWGLSLSLDIIWLPVSGAALVLAGIAAGWLFVPVLGLKDKSRASFLISSSLANHGFTMGAFLCYLFFGETGLGLAFIFLSYFMLYVFTVIFPYARMVSTSQSYSLSFLKDFLLNLQNMPLIAIMAGLTLHIFGIDRPRVHFPIDLFILVSIAVYYLTLGLNFTAADIKSSLRETLALSVIKFLMIPAATFLVLAVVNLEAPVEAVILMQSFMPAAIYSVVASVLFDLDTGLASNLFVMNSILFLIVILPLLFVFRQYIFPGMV
ncbi:MAG TPA: hypothetical protein PLM29_15865 [Deltaproteobacteria bacterium]|nr:hypothetical protein [Deltaproteobacteria bacterium]